VQHVAISPMIYMTEHLLGYSMQLSTAWHYKKNLACYDMLSHMLESNIWISHITSYSILIICNCTAMTAISNDYHKHTHTHV